MSVQRGCGAAVSDQRRGCVVLCGCAVRLRGARLSRLERGRLSERAEQERLRGKEQQQQQKEERGEEETADDGADGGG